MNKIRTVIVDDDTFAIENLIDDLIPYDNIEVINTFRDGRTGLEGINQQRPDLVFVDIEMPELNGFEMLSRLEYSPVIVFCTGYSKYALEGYDYDPADFIIKPVKKEKFRMAMEKAFRDLENQDHERRLLNQKIQHGYLLLEFREHNESRTVCVYPDEILFIQSHRDYVEYHLREPESFDLPTGSGILIKKTLKKALDELQSQGFLQVHKGYVINSRKIREFRDNTYLLLEGLENTIIPVSREGRKLLKAWLKKEALS